ncbi:hypothetical protein ACQ7CX_11655 [Chryseobacterium arthrosphaerae]|uniref:hypothetical protein n=1 Tax=Chryseobacterium arthrosphaerae TaxID=651561 RepID=UPI001BAF18D1|nr:hypothetical protein [Chryseobacterium arthrosphaerae]QUY54092.1 hypothetical protein I2F65_14490 [Chryseobacterium arthrosphaerae]
MTVFGYFVLAVALFSLYIAYRIFEKISKQRNVVKGDAGLLEKSAVLFFICLLTVGLNSLTAVLSYTFFWEKAYRAVNENKYEAVVVGYKKETVKNQNFRNSAYDTKVVYFPEVKYTDSEGKEVIKTVDITGNQPLAIGQQLKITDGGSKDSANSIELDWILLIFGGVFTGATTFFASLLATYSTKLTFKRRLTLSSYITGVIVLINIMGVILIYLKQ